MMEGNLNLENLDLHDPSMYNNHLLAKIYDQVDSGKMPPPKKKKKKAKKKRKRSPSTSTELGI